MDIFSRQPDGRWSISRFIAFLVRPVPSPLAGRCQMVAQQTQRHGRALVLVEGQPDLKPPFDLGPDPLQARPRRHGVLHHPRPGPRPHQRQLHKGRRRPQRQIVGRHRRPSSTTAGIPASGPISTAASAPSRRYSPSPTVPSRCATSAPCRGRRIRTARSASRRKQVILAVAGRQIDHHSGVGCTKRSDDGRQNLGRHHLGRSQPHPAPRSPPLPPRAALPRRMAIARALRQCRQPCLGRHQPPRPPAHTTPSPTRLQRGDVPPSVAASAPTPARRPTGCRGRPQPRSFASDPSRNPCETYGR